MKKKSNKVILDEYVVKFWYTDTDGFSKQENKSMYAEGKCNHEKIEKEFLKEMNKTHNNIKVVSVTYQ